MGDVTVSVDWLAQNLKRDDLVVVDGSWHLPPANRDPKAEYVDAHIPGAVFFDLDAVSDQNADLPHMLPTAENFARDMGMLGICETDTIVVYDAVGLFSAARIWWMFRHFGAKNVFVLDGGLPAWKKAGHATESGPVRRSPALFTPNTILNEVVNITDVQAAIESEAATILDARGAGRFTGAEAEPRAGMRSGHMPTAINLPFTKLLNADSELLPADDLRAVFDGLAFDSAKPIIASCGSGVTACVIILALVRLGLDDAKLYDGSWSEWGGRFDTAVVSG